MSAQMARRIRSEAPAGDGTSDAVLELSCGCVVEVRLAKDRLVTAEDGTRLAVGKYRCPAGHPPGWDAGR